MHLTVSSTKPIWLNVAYSIGKYKRTPITTMRTKFRSLATFHNLINSHWSLPLSDHKAIFLQELYDGWKCSTVPTRLFVRVRSQLICLATEIDPSVVKYQRSEQRTKNEKKQEWIKKGLILHTSTIYTSLEAE